MISYLCYGKSFKIISFENAFYHITARGIRKENIFYSDKDKKLPG